jgi:hypothetical protein
MTHARDVLDRAAAQVGVPSDEAELIRDGSNVMWTLPGGVVARIGPAGSTPLARRQLSAARWLSRHGVSVVRPIPDLEQPVVVDDRPVTWWQQLPAHRPARTGELGALLRQVHELPLPQPGEVDDFGELDPFDGLEPLVKDDLPAGIGEGDQAWLRARVTELRRSHAAQRAGSAVSVVHGDAWQGNVAVPLADGEPILLDLDRIGFGPPEWDLIPIAVDHTDFARIDADDYQRFVDALGGIDVTRSPMFPILAAVTQLRWTAFVISKADANAAALAEARHRIACLRGAVPKPWTWSAF